MRVIVKYLYDPAEPLLRCERCAWAIRDAIPYGDQPLCRPCYMAVRVPRGSIWRVLIAVAVTVRLTFLAALCVAGRSLFRSITAGKRSWKTMSNEERIEMMRTDPHTVNVPIRVTAEEMKQILIECHRQGKSLSELARAALLVWLRPDLRPPLQGPGKSAGTSAPPGKMQ
jgi:hypothetical protein